MSALLVFSPAIIWGILFTWSYRKEPRQFKNAIFFLLMLIFAFGACAIYTNDIGIVLLLGIAIPFAPIITVGFLLVNAWIVIRREGFSLFQTSFPRFSRWQLSPGLSEFQWVLE